MPLRTDCHATPGIGGIPLCKGVFMTKTFAPLAALLALAAGGIAIDSPASAKGCIRGAVAGGVAGHYAHHHAIAGAAAGCAIAHHHYSKKAKAEAAAAPRG